MIILKLPKNIKKHFVGEEGLCKTEKEKVLSRWFIYYIPSF